MSDDPIAPQLPFGLAVVLQQRQVALGRSHNACTRTSMETVLLIHSARELTDDEAGGHGNRWGVFDDDVPELIGRVLELALEKSEVLPPGLGDKISLQRLVADGEPAAAALLYTGKEPGAGKEGLMSLLHHDAGGEGRAASLQLWSAFPFFGDGVEVEAEVEQVCLFPNRIEARLDLGLAGGGLIEAFDPCFWQNRAVYRSGERYRFSVSALAYRMGPAPALEHVIDDEHEIRRFHARDAWAQAHGHWTRDDEEASLAAWQPESPEELAPIRISMGEMAALLSSSSGPADDAQFQGQVVRVTPRAVRMLDVDFWRVDTVVMRADEDLILPIYVAERLFDDDWRPEVGQYVSGTLWLQAYATSRLPGPVQGGQE